MAAEQLTANENGQPESTAACDVFALGCLIFFVLSKGSHPYGPPAERDYHIIHDKYSLSALDDVTSRSLVEDMIQHKSKTRPSAEAVVNHPFFWATKETMSFMQEVSSLAKSCNHADLDLVQCLEKDKHLVLGGRPDKHNSWKARIGEAIDAGVDAGLSKEKEQHKQNKSTKKAYDETVAELLRFNRNKVQHFDELPAEARSIVGSTREEFVQYILRMFPGLVLHVWKSLFNISTECGLNNYYKAHHKFRLSSDVTPDAEENSRPSVSGPAVQDSNIEECRTRHADDLKKDSEPTSNMHLLLILHNNPDMTSLRVPASGRPWNLHIVANTCNNLTKVDLRGFDIDLQSLSKLAKQNRLLEEVTLPAGCTDEQLEALLTPLEHLRRLEVSSPNGTGRWLQRLSPSLKTLYIKGPGAPLEPERPVFSDKGLAVYVSHVTDSTLSILTGVAARLCKLYIDDCPEVTASGLLRLGSLTKLENLNLHGMSAGVPKNAEQGSPGNTGLWLQNLPPSLLRLYISGPGAPLEPERPVSSDKGLAVYVSHVTDSTLSLLTGVAERRVNLCIDDCPEVTARGLLHLGSVLRLKILTLYGGSGGVVTDAMLDSLHSCSGLKLLMLGDRRRPPETAITAAAVSRLMVACRKLDELYLHITADCSQAVLTALWQTDLGRDRYGGLRVIDLLVPGPVFSQLRWPDGGPVISGRDGRRWTPSGNAIYVWEWEE